MNEPIKGVLFGYFEEEFAKNNIQTMEQKQKYLDEKYTPGGFSLYFNRRNLARIPYEFVLFKGTIRILSLEYNDLEDLSFLKYFPLLITLRLSRNLNLKCKTLPFLPHLINLNLERCEFDDLYEWLQCIQKQCPELKELSVVGSYFRAYNITVPEVLHRRKAIISLFPKLEILDGKNVTADEMPIANLSLDDNS